MKHYEIIKEAYSLGYERILIMEDDVRFHRDLEYIQKMLKNIPDSDIVMFDKMTCSAVLEGTKYKKYIKTLPADSLYGNMNDSGVFFIFCSCYSLNRKAMKQIIATQEKNLLPPDTPLNDKTLTGSFAVINLAIQDPNMKTREVESYSKIGLDVSVYGAEEKTETAPKPAAPVSQPPAKGLEKKIRETSGALQAAPTDNKKPKQVIFRMPLKPTVKKRIEPARPFIPDKRKTTKTRVIAAKSSGYNKLYET
jgi:GR25 family glycosyltransferase involved in LPS biosynthesis